MSNDMPKTFRETRKYQAQELLERVKHGPHFISENYKMTVGEYQYQYKLWAESWIIPELLRLVPELRAAKAEGKNAV
jgi:hypothetical protein